MTSWIKKEDVQAYLGTDKITLSDADVLGQTASDAVQAVLNRDLTMVTNLTEYYDTNGTDYILLNNWPVRSIGSVTLNGMAILPAIPGQPGWRLDGFNPRKLMLGQGRLLRGGIMVIGVLNQTAGYDFTQSVGSATGLPGTVHRALLLTCAAIFNAQAADPNLSSESTGGVFSGTFYPSGVGAVPPGALRLLSNEIRVAG